MTSPLHIIIDTSGSMNEMGKIHLQRNLSRYAVQLQGIAQEKHTDLNIHVYQWDKSISETIIQSGGDIPALTAKGSSNLCDLSDFLSQHQKDTERARILILSDGNYSNSDISSFQKQLSSCPGLIIRTVAVGADADLLKLKKISTNNSVYLSENISSAIDSTIFGSDEPLIAPSSTAQILQSASPEKEEPEEDWDA